MINVNQHVFSYNKKKLITLKYLSFGFFYCLDAAPYAHSQCPCPMQPIPKNVHTGLLIGSKSTDKSPGQQNNNNNNNNITFATNLISSSTTMTSTPSPISAGSIPSSTIRATIPADKIKTETFNEPIKSFYLHPMYACNDDKTYHQTQPNYTLNSKLLEQPEMSISPARGSTGLPGLMPIHGSATQPHDDIIDEKLILSSKENSITSTSTKSLIKNMDTISTSTITTPSLIPSSFKSASVNARRARVGKTMAREQMMQSHQITIPSSKIDCKIQIKEYTKLDDIDQYHADKTPHFLNVTKKNNVKTEIDDDVVIVSINECNNKQNENSICNTELISNNTTSPMKRKQFNSDIIIDLDETPTNSITSIKRRRTLEFNKNFSKKSPPNSYKNLIKPYDTKKSYLCKSDRSLCEPIDYSSKQQNTFDDENSIVSIDDTDSSSAIEDTTHEMITATTTTTPTFTKTSATDDNKINEIDKNITPITSTPKLFIADEFPEELTIAKKDFMSSLELTLDQVAKGYYSDNDILADKQQQRLKNKLKLSEGRSRSESKKDAKKFNQRKSSRTRDRSISTSSTSTISFHSRERASKATATKLLKVVARESSPEMDFISIGTNGRKKSTKRDTKSKTTNKSKAKKLNTKEIPIDNNIIINELLVNEAIINHNNNNNNNVDIENNNKVHLNNYIDSATTSRSTTPLSYQNGRQMVSKKSKSRGTKFSNKKRHRTRTVKEIEEVYIPRRSSAVPKWSNGWTWRGEPFKGKVFLNVSIFIKTFCCVHLFIDFYSIYSER